MYVKSSCMLLLNCFFFILLFLIQYGQPCTICSFGPWMQWGGCSQTCGGGDKSRQRIVCCPGRQSYDHCINKRCRKAQSDIWQSSACNQDCYNGGVFERNKCKCSAGWQGYCCNKACEFPYFGDNCLQQCDCEHGVCDHVTGKCDCLIGWTGRECNQTCADGYFGNDCQNVCSCENGDCDHVSGNCTCFPGWTGTNCSTPCDIPYFGNGCQEKCECKNGNCSHVTGQCTCLPGWIGITCADKVKSAPFGTLFISTATGCVVGLILILICTSLICMKFCRRKIEESQTTIRNTQTAYTNVAESSPYHEYIDAAENIINGNPLDKYESLLTSGSYEHVSNYDIILKPNVGCENSMNELLNQYEPLRGANKISPIHIYSDNPSYDDSMYTEIYG
ncbi:multiple epidermal growth factor-like domains protein 10 [Mytilus trossulus]|uniref:multiple epidermal growth factor-like domains protein 10 n=1 Tax=Mytilus trossulus TaxID=6551 RepID=UPI003007E460